MKRIFITVLLFFSFSIFANEITNEITYKDWRFLINIDPISDKKMPMILTFGRDFESATFAMTCDVVILNPVSKKWGGNQDDIMKVIYRVEVDKQKPIEMEWVKFDDGIATKKEYFRNDAIQNGKMLVIGAGSNSTRDFTFSLLGYKKAYERLEKECSN